MLINNFKFDLDGVLIDSLDAIEKSFADHRYTVTNPGEYNFKLDPHCSEEHVVELIRDGLRKNECPPAKGASAFSNYAWGETQQPFEVITVRHPALAGKTFEDASNALNMLPFKIAMVRDAAHKLKFLGDVDCYIDDRRKTAMSLAHHGKTVFMPRTSYNDLTDYTRDFPVMTHDQVPEYVPLMSESALFTIGRIIIIDSLWDLIDPKYKPLLFKEVIFDRVREVLIPDEQI